MTSVFKFRRGTTADANALTGQEGEIFVDLQAKALRLHDGVFKGGYEISSANSGATTERTLLVAQAARDTANSAFIAANAAQTRTADLSARATSQAAFDKANSSTTLAQSAFNQGNTATTLAQAAYNTANTDKTNISVAPGTYGNSTHVPVITLESNGRISSVSSNPITAVIAITSSGGIGGSVTQEDVQDYVAPLFTHNYHDGGRITFTYDDVHNLIIANVISSLSSNSSNGGNGGSGVDQYARDSVQSAFNTANTALLLAAQGQLTQEQVQDYVAPLLAHSSHINGKITFTYSDDTNQLIANVISAPQLTTARTINDISFDGSQNITILKVEASNTANQLSTARTINDISFDGSRNITILKVEASNTANQAILANTANQANKLSTPRTINDISFDGSQNITILKVEASNTANLLSTARTINGVPFNGTQNITINAVDSTPRIAISSINALNGVAGLDSGGQISIGAVPTLSIGKIDDFSVFFPTAGQVLTYNGSKFENKTRVTTSSSPPSTASSLVGDLWINSDTGRQYILISDSASVKNWIQLG